MSQEVMNIIETCVLTPLFIAVSSFIIAFLHKQTTKLQEKVKDEKVKNLIETANGIVEQAVTAVTQTYVDGLKADGVFDKDAQNIAFNKAKDSIYTLFTNDIVNAIKDNYGSIDEWVATKIEESISKNK